MTFVRVTFVVAFIAVMIAWKFVLHAVVDIGYLPWLLLMAAVFWAGWKLDNHDRRARGEAEWTTHEAKQEVRSYFKEPTPYILVGLVACAALFRWSGL